MDASETAMDSSALPSDSAQLVVSQAPAPESVVTLVVSDEGTVLGTVDTPSSSNLPEASLIKSMTNISDKSFRSMQTKKKTLVHHHARSQSTKSHHSSHPSKSGAPQSSHQSTLKPKSHRPVKSYKKREDGTSRPSNHATPSVDTTHSATSQHPITASPRPKSTAVKPLMHMDDIQSEGQFEPDYNESGLSSMDTQSVGKSLESQSSNPLNNLSAQLCNTNDHLSKVAGNIQEFTLFCTSTQAECWGNLCSELQILNTQLAVQNNELKGINPFIRSFSKSQEEKEDKLLGSIKQLSAAITKGEPAQPARKSDTYSPAPAQRSTAPSSMDFDKLKNEFEEDWDREQQQPESNSRRQDRYKHGAHVDGSPHGQVRPIQTAKPNVHRLVWELYMRGWNCYGSVGVSSCWEL